MASERSRSDNPPSGPTTSSSGRRRGRVRGEQRRPRIEDPARLLRGHRDPGEEAERRAHFRDARAPALLGRGDRHAPPVGLAARGALARQAHDAALAHHRLDPGHAQLDRLLDDPVHLVGLGQPLREADRDRGLALDVAPRTDLHVDAVLVDALDGGVVLAAAAVEDHERVARFQAQRLGHVLGGVGREGELRAGPEAQLAMDAGTGHGVSSSCRRR